MTTGLLPAPAPPPPSLLPPQPLSRMSNSRLAWTASDRTEARPRSRPQTEGTSEAAAAAAAATATATATAGGTAAGRKQGVREAGRVAAAAAAAGWEPRVASCQVRGMSRREDLPVFPAGSPLRKRWRVLFPRSRRLAHFSHESFGWSAGRPAGWMDGWMAAFSFFIVFFVFERKIGRSARVRITTAVSCVSPPSFGSKSRAVQKQRCVVPSQPRPHPLNPGAPPDCPWARFPRSPPNKPPRSARNL